MSIVLNDATSGTQRLAADNSSNFELGSATPSSKLSFQGRNLLSGSVLDQRTAAPPSMARISGAVALNGFAQATISTPTTAGFAGVGGSGTVVSFASDKSSFVILNADSATQTISYAVF